MNQTVCSILFLVFHLMLLIVPCIALRTPVVCSFWSFCGCVTIGWSIHQLMDVWDVFSVQTLWIKPLPLFVSKRAVDILFITWVKTLGAEWLGYMVVVCLTQQEAAELLWKVPSLCTDMYENCSGSPSPAVAIVSHFKAIGRHPSSYGVLSHFSFDLYFPVD